MSLFAVTGWSGVCAHCCSCLLVVLLALGYSWLLTGLLVVDLVLVIVDGLFALGYAVSAILMIVVVIIV